jgi:hypothetical protein
MDLAQLLETVQQRCCRLCRHGYFRDDRSDGLCKRSENAFGVLPKIIDELDTCPLWQSKEK